MHFCCHIFAASSVSPSYALPSKNSKAVTCCLASSEQTSIYTHFCWSRRNAVEFKPNIELFPLASCLTRCGRGAGRVFPKYFLTSWSTRQRRHVPLGRQEGQNGKGDGKGSCYFTEIKQSEIFGAGVWWVWDGIGQGIEEDRRQSVHSVRRRNKGHKPKLQQNSRLKA